MTPQRKHYLQTHHCRRKKDAQGNPVEMRMTFDEWFEVWTTSGHWEERGRRKGQYCMCRFGDLGHYELGNVYIGRVEENIREYNESGRRRKAKPRVKAGRPPALPPDGTDRRLKHNYETMLRMRKYRERLKQGSEVSNA